MENVMSKIEKEYEIRMKTFIDNKMRAIVAGHGRNSYSWGYRDAMEEVLKYLNDMIKVKEMLDKQSLSVL